MRRWMKLGIVFVVTSAIICFGIFLFKIYEGKKSQRVFNETFNEENWRNPLENAGIRENLEIYMDDEQLKADGIYITVLKSKKNGREQNFKDITSFSEGDGIPESKVEIFFEDGSKKILQNGIFIREPNATIEIRGKSSEKALQKSFKIRLFDREGLWHNQNIINLNKHYSDSLRIRNKLSFDYFKIIPNITSLRTRFVRLFVKDLSAEVPKDTFEDYGLFTQIEQPNKLFLKNHGLDPNGHLYKAENFKFLRYPENIRNKKDSTFSKKDFEDILEIKGDEDHQKLITMLDDVNDYSNDINEVVENHFDKENFLTWVAVNILFDNYEKINTDFLLYSPLNSNKWYFMPWNFDEAWELETDRPKWQKGLSMFWDNVLFKRYFEEPENIMELNKKIEELSKIVNRKKTKDFLDGYYDIVMSDVTKLPDLRYLTITLKEYKRQYEELTELAERNRLYYYEVLENPMPFSLGEVKYNGDKYVFTWGESFDIQDHDLYYDFELSNDKSFSTVIRTAKDIKGLTYELENLKEGIYYWRVKVRDKEGNSQIAYNILRDEYGDEYYGIKKFAVDKRMALEIFEREAVKTEIIENSKDEVEIEHESSSINQSMVKEKELESKAVQEKNNKAIENTKKSYDTYTLKAGETLFYVSMKFYGHQGMIEKIRKLNGIRDINSIRTGTKLKLPQGKDQYRGNVPELYKLKSGESLFSVSMRFYGSKGKIEEIKKLNNIEDVNDIPSGKILKLPRK
ncbi:CotH kinase family protein [Wukongibacter sp. M2B1]|uniref:CotH kinase family protein n=1 Tax=Wukongibacter sp. M2B1 TaxID=3088895 RepID=UPI003D7B1B7E